VSFVSTLTPDSGAAWGSALNAEGVKFGAAHPSLCPGDIYRRGMANLRHWPRVLSNEHRFGSSGHAMRMEFRRLIGALILDRPRPDKGMSTKELQELAKDAWVNFYEGDDRCLTKERMRAACL
jgi:hypothetical protein